MPINHEAVAALPTTTSPASKTLTRNMTVRRMPYVLLDADDSRDLVAVDPSTGAVIIDILYLGRVFHYYPTDTTTAHDGTTCLVSYEGKRYKLSDGDDVFAYSVANNTLSTPPGSPTIGDAYLVAAGATGAWAGHDDDVAVYTARGWEFVTYAIGRLLYIEAGTNTDTYYHRNAAGDWTAGFGTQAISSGSVRPSALIGKPIRWIVENQTTNTPPGTASVGVAYIIGPSPTGAWAGQAAKLAICEVTNTFTIYTPRTGELAYDKTLAKDVRYSGTAWIAGADAFVLINTQLASASAMIDFIDGLDDTYDAYEICISNVKPATDDVEFWLRVGTGAGPTYQTTGYRYSTENLDATGLANIAESAGGKIKLSYTSGTGLGVGNAAGENICGVIRFNNPELSDYVQFGFDMAYSEASGSSARIFGGGRYDTPGAVTGIRFMFSSGNIAAGRFSLYGLRKA